MGFVSLPSPCISICEIDENTGWCLGCFRTRPEIARWQGLNDEQKHQLLEQLIERKNLMTGLRRRPRRAGQKTKIIDHKGDYLS